MSQRPRATRTATPTAPSLAEPTTSRLAIEYVPLETVRRWPTNPKEHDLGAIAASVERFGFRDPIAVNRRTGEIEEGHGRVETLVAFRQQQRPAPSFVVAGEDGAWSVPVVWFDDDALTQHGYALAHNRTQELGGGYDDVRLLEALQEQQRADALDGLGFDDDDVRALHRKFDEDTRDLSSSEETFKIVVTCRDEAQQRELLERFAEEGLTCQALML